MIDSNTLNFGPGVVFIGAVPIYTAGDIVAKPVVETFAIPTSHGGELDARAKSITWDIEFTPAGQITDAIMAALCPWQSPLPGASLRGSSDTTVIVHGFDGQKATFYGCGVFNMPSLNFGVDKTLFGSCTIKVLGANNTDVDDGAKFFALATEDFSDTSFELSQCITQAYDVAYGSSSPWDAIRTDDAGVVVEHSLSWKPRYVSGEGIVDYTLSTSGTQSVAKFRPINPTVAQFLALQKLQGYGLGVSMVTGANNLVVSGTGVHFTLYKARPHDGALNWGDETYRQGELSMTGTREAWNDSLFRLASSAPA